jgi:hypothetical protein
MKLASETVIKTLSVLGELVNNATLNVSRNRYDFYADRLRVATTESNLLAAVNRYSELLGCPVLSEQATMNIMRASSAADAKAVYQWLREQPKVAIGMTKIKYDERAAVIDALVEAYEAQEVKEGIQKPRRPFDIGITALVTQALAHGDDAKAGNAQLFRRCDVRGGLRLPFYSGNAIGGAMRDLLADHYLQALGIRLDKAEPAVNIWAFHLLYSGGIMADGAIPKEFERVLTGAAAGTMRSDGVRQLRNMIPFFSMMGGIGKTPMEGYAYINDLRPQCIEWGTGDTSVNDLMSWRFIARRDDFEGRTSKAQLEAGDSQAETANTSMLANTECLAEGVVLEGGIDVSDHMTEIEMSALARGLLLLQEHGYLGGKKHRGYGRVNIEYQTSITLDPKPYDDYLQAHKEVIINYLQVIGAFPQPGQVSQWSLL